MTEHREVSIASLTGSVVEFRAHQLKISRGQSSELHKGFLLSAGYIHPKWAFPTGPSLSQTIDNRPVLATTIRTFEHPRMRAQRNPRNLSSLLTVRTISLYEHQAVRQSVLESNELSQFSIDNAFSKASQFSLRTNEILFQRKKSFTL